VWAKGLKQPYFVYVGTFSENKNQRRVLEAWAALQKVHPQLPALVLAGPCPEDYRKAVIGPALANLPRAAEVLLPGRISNEDLAWAYGNALGVLQPSIAEGFGLPIIEAMSLGVPVVCSNTTSLPETAGGAARLFDPFHPTSIGEAVLELWQDAALRERLSTQGRERSRAFTWRQSAEKIAAEIERQLS
jgi:glycosyltransferase involved in cell wall biosynthesis